MSTSEQTAITMPALGRPFQLGMLYDCRSDQLIPGITLWNNETLQMDVGTKPQPKTEFQIITSDSIEEKASSLGVSASLKASFLCGLIEVKGSASYLNNKKTSKQQARVSLQYSTTTVFEHLTMTHLGRKNVSYPDVFDQGTATHVVTAVLYGAQAFFVFDCEFSTSENIQDIQGNLQIMIKKIPCIAIEGKGSLTMSDKDIKNAKTFSCKFHGDFSLQSNPTNYQEAITIYSTLPKLLGEKGEKAVPVKVWLYPLQKLDSKAAQVVREISHQLVFDAQAVLETMSEINMQCNDLMKHPAAATFPEIRKKVQQFQEHCMQYTLTFQRKLAQTLPSIRGGGKEEQALVDILISQRQSPFNFQSLSEFLDDKLQEMDFVNSFLTILKDVRAIATENDLNRILMNPMTEYVVAFTFTSLKDEELFLLDLKNWLQAEILRKKNIKKAQSIVYKKENTKHWISQPNISKTTRKYVMAFQEFFFLNESNKTTQFIVSSVLDQSNPGACIYLYEAGDLLCMKFEPPSKPNPPLTGRITHNSVELTLRPSESGQEWIEMYKIEYRSTNEEKWVDIRTNQKLETFTIKGLKPNSKYEFRYCAVCKPGLSAVSDITTASKTLPTSPPGTLAGTAIHPQAITLTWKAPSVIANGVTITDYEIEYRKTRGGGIEEKKGGWLKLKVGKKLETFTIKGLDPNTSYRFRVYAICKDVGVSTPSEKAVIITLDD
ncbi:cytolytic toxin-alpha-like [Lissotriton helveticus]